MDIQFHSRDVQILRQSQLKMAHDFVQSHGVVLTLEELLRVSDVLVECAIRPIDNDLKDRIKKLDKWIADKKVNNG